MKLRELPGLVVMLIAAAACLLLGLAVVMLARGAYHLLVNAI